MKINLRPEPDIAALWPLLPSGASIQISGQRIEIKGVALTSMQKAAILAELKKTHATAKEE